MKGLTDKQRKILDFIGRFIASSAMAPTVYEIAEHFKIKTSTVFAHLRALQRKGSLTRSSKARSISLNKPKRRARKSSAASMLPVPVVGMAGAGTPLPHSGAEGAKSCELFFDPAILDMDANNDGLFAMKVQGHGLRDLGIFDGDIVVAKPAVSLRNGDIVVSSSESGTHLVGAYKQTQSDDATLEESVPACVKGVVVALQRKLWTKSLES